MKLLEEYLPCANGFALKMFTRHLMAQKRVFAEHRHIALEIGYFKSGSGIYKTSTKDYTIKAGDVFVFRSNEPHWIAQIEKEEMTLVNLQFEPRLLFSKEHEFFDYIRLFTGNNPNFSNRLARDNPKLEKIRTELLEIENELGQKSKDYPLAVKLHLLKIFVLLERHFDYKNENNANILCKNNLESIENAMNYLHAHLTEDITLADLAKEANMSQTYFSAVFKNINGVSPWGYVTAKRIELAISYLIRDAGTVLEIALKCGFNNTANFNKIFKKITGYTPREYKINGHADLE